MTSTAPAPENPSHKPSALTPDFIKQREREAVAMVLRLALGYARKAAKTPLFAAEVGVYRGRTLALLATELDAAGADAVVVGFDSFAGLPELSERDIELASPLLLQRRELLFSDTSKREVEAFLEPYAARKNIELHEGSFETAFAQAPERNYFFVNMSCKLHSSHLAALEYFYPRMAPGGVILFDDYLDKSFPMARAAVDEFLADKPETICQLQSGEGSSTFRRVFVTKS